MDSFSPSPSPLVGTAHSQGSRWRGAAGFLGAMLLATSAEAATLLSENFDDVTTLPGSGWALVNNSSPIGSSGWFQGNAAIFPAQAGGPNAYVAANFLNADSGGDISNWLISPNLTLDDGDIIQFFTRTDLFGFPDSLELRWSSNGASTSVGATAASVGDFTSLLLSVNPGLAVDGYPATWTAFSATLSGLGGPTSGRFAFRYLVPDTAVNGNYIGIDTVTVSAQAIPEAGTLSSLSILGLAVAGMTLRRWRRA